MKKLGVEFLGTFFLVLTIGTNVLAGNPMAPLAIAAVLAALIYAGGHVSGAHYNPAVTIAFWLRGKCSLADVAGYWIAQCLAACAASATVAYLRMGVIPESTLIYIGEDIGPAWVAEFVFTFALAYTILNVATAAATAGNSFYGIAIALVVLAGAWSVGALTGAAFNPAVAIGAAMMHILRWQEIWIHIVASCLAGVSAALAFRWIHGHETDG